MFLFDPGYTITGSCHSSISHSTEDGHLYYRGYNVRDLAKKSSFLETCFLLMFGDLPAARELAEFETIMKDEMIIHQNLLDFFKGFALNAHPMSIMCSIVGAFSSFVHENLDVKDPKQRELSALKLTAKMPVLAAIAFRTSVGLPIVQPDRKMSYTENFLHMMFSDPMDDSFKVPKIFVETMDKIFILHAEMDQGPSTTAVRIAGSSLANPFAATAAGFASLWGETHGGANEHVLDMLESIGSLNQVPAFIEKIKSKDTVLMGFGHRIFKNYDPRALEIKEMIVDLEKKLGTNDHLF
jgi:citrate synthase